jgi:hypothetical protein
MGPKDRVALIRFNENCHIIFDLNEKEKNRMFLRNSIQNSHSNFECVGETAFYAAIYEGLEIFKRAGN